MNKTAGGDVFDGVSGLPHVACAGFEGEWAKLPDAKTAPVELSYWILEGVHARWVALLRSMTEAQWSRKFRHPELGVRDLTNTLGLYAWHGKHHVAHLALIRSTGVPWWWGSILQTSAKSGSPTPPGSTRPAITQ